MSSAPFVLPWLPPARIVPIPGRGEFFVRHHQHPDRSRPTVLLLHGWTASGDLQFFTAYEALAAEVSFVAVDHRGHGRGLRTATPFSLEDAADDAALVLDELGIASVVAMGYSMGGPISMLLARRHPARVDGLIVQATALEWIATITERMTWLWLPVLGAALRSWAFPRYIRRSLPRLIADDHQLAPYLPWITGELQRGNPHAIVEAGRALRDHDARSWARELGVPAAMLLTTKDRLVRPRKQRQLAAALAADVVELDGDHFCTLAQPAEYADATVRLVRAMVQRLSAVTA